MVVDSACVSTNSGYRLFDRSSSKIVSVLKLDKVGGLTGVGIAQKAIAATAILAC